MLPKGVHRVIARAREYFYFQANRGTKLEGQRLTLPKDPHSPEFWTALRKAQGIEQTPDLLSFDAVCDLYETSNHFNGDDLSDSTRRQYRSWLKKPRLAWGRLPANGVRPVAVRALLDELGGTPGMANNVLCVLRALNQWGLQRGHFDHSITEGVKGYKSKGGHVPWTAAQCAAAEQHFTGNLRKAYFLLRHTGQRGSDVVKMGETYIDDGGFRLSQKKTDVEIWCPIEPVLAAEMATWERWPGPYLRQNHGKVYSHDLLEHHFAEARDLIPEIAGATLHGLRGTRVVELRQRGNTTLQIQDQVGMSLRMIERYCRFADKKANGKAAVIAMAERRKNSAL